MSRDQILALIDATTATIAAHADELTRLDQAIGDGDHGSNMARGFQAIAAQREALAGLELGDALQKAGMILVTTVGGASGPLYGSLLMGIGKGLKAGKAPAEALAEGVESVKKRASRTSAPRPCSTCWCRCSRPVRPARRRRAAPRRQREPRRDQAHAGHPRPRLLPGRALDRPLRSGRHSSCLLIHAVCDVLEPAA